MKKVREKWVLKHDFKTRSLSFQLFSRCWWFYLKGLLLCAVYFIWSQFKNLPSVWSFQSRNLHFMACLWGIMCATAAGVNIFPFSSRFLGKQFWKMKDLGKNFWLCEPSLKFLPPKSCEITFLMKIHKYLTLKTYWYCFGKLFKIQKILRKEFSQKSGGNNSQIWEKIFNLDWNWKNLAIFDFS